MANISRIKLNDIIYTLKDTVSGYATEDYVDEAIEAIKQFNAIICTSNENTPIGVVWTRAGEKYIGTLLPDDAEQRTFYLVYQEQGSGNDYYDEYLVVDNGSTKSWEKIGNTHIDLSNYYTKSEVNSLGQGILNQANTYTDTATSVKQDKLTAGNHITIDPNNVISIDGDIGKVQDVNVDGTSVLDSEGVAQIDLTGKQDKIENLGELGFGMRDIAWFQGKLTAGPGISISPDNVISSSGSGGGYFDVVDGKLCLVWDDQSE